MLHFAQAAPSPAAQSAFSGGTFLNARANDAAFGLSILALAVALAVVAPDGYAQAQDPGEETIAPFGSDMVVKKKQDGVNADTILKAIADSDRRATEIKELSTLDSVEIVDLKDLPSAVPAEKLDKTLSDNSESIDTLHSALEANALTYAALDSRALDVTHVIGVELSGDRDKSITFYVQ